MTRKKIMDIQQESKILDEMKKRHRSLLGNDKIRASLTKEILEGWRNKITALWFWSDALIMNCSEINIAGRKEAKKSLEWFENLYKLNKVIKKNG